MRDLNPKFIFLSLSCLLFSIMAYGQKTLKGTVVDQGGLPIVGAVVKEPKTKFSTLTDKEGQFIIGVAQIGLEIEFSSIGFAKVSVKVDKPNQRIVMVDNINDLTEVVIVGYGTSSREDLTGSVSKAPVEDMKKAAVGSFVQSLQGRVAGVAISSNDGAPGSMPSITIRGGNSITQSNAPLYVIDGFPIENPDPGMLNPQDIESIDILKDASSTAIYGSRGANGVIIVNTKKSTKGGAAISFNAYAGAQRVMKTMDLLSGYEFVKLILERDSIGNVYRVDPITNEQAYASAFTYLRNASLEDYRKFDGVNYQDKLFRASLFNNYDLSLRGGDKGLTYLISGNYFDQNGVIINSGYRRYQGRINLEQKLSSKFKLGINTNYSVQEINGQPSNYVTNSQPSTLSLFSSVWGYRPIGPIGVNGDLELNLEDVDFDPETAYSGTSDYRMNPITNQNNTFDRTKNKSLFANTYAEWEIVKGLILKSTVGYSAYQSEKRRFFNSKTMQGNPLFTVGNKGANGQFNNYETLTFSTENTLTFRKTFNKKHNLNIVGIFSQQQQSSNSNGAQSVWLPNESLGISALGEGDPYAIFYGASDWSLLSYAARANYDFKKRYYLTATWRADGSSKFAPDNRWGYFPSGAFKWNISNEKFFRNLKAKGIMNSLSLRVSYGNTGNNRVSDFSYLSPLTVSPRNNAYVFNGKVISGAAFTKLGNMKLKWETTSQFNTGIDFSILKDRATVVVDYYSKRTKDLLLDATLPGSSGFLSALKNVGSVQNRGMEFTVNTINLNKGKLTWTSTFNISFNRNKILALAEGQETLSRGVNFDGNYGSLPAYISKIGSPVGQMYGLIWDGVYQYSDFDYTTAENPYANGKGLGSHWVLKPAVTTNGAASTRMGVQPGDIKYRDLNGDGQITPDDYTVIGSAQPIHTGGFGNTFGYRGFTLDLFFQWSYGNDVLNANRILFEGNPNRNAFYNQFASIKDRWTPQNQNTTIPRSYGAGPAFFSSRVIEDGSYLRLKTVNLGYQIPQKFYTKYGFKGLKIYATAQNLLTFTKYSGIDPEVNVTRSILTPGFDFSSYPSARTLVLGLNANF